MPERIGGCAVGDGKTLCSTNALDVPCGLDVRFT